MTPKEIAKTALRAADGRKASGLAVLNVEPLTTLADYFVICSGSSNTQLRAIADAVEEELSKHGLEPGSIEGYRAASWVLLDYGSVVVHIFKGDAREFYSLDRLWSDAKKENIEEWLKD